MKDELEVNLLSKNAFATYATLALIGFMLYKFNNGLAKSGGQGPTGTIGVRG